MWSKLSVPVHRWTDVVVNHLAAMCWCLSQWDGTSAWTHRFQPIVFFVAPVNESSCKDSWDRTRRLNALKGNKIMNANESYSFLAHDLQRWYLESGLRRPRLFLLYHRKSHKTREECKARCLFHHILQKRRLFLILYLVLWEQLQGIL